MAGIEEGAVGGQCVRVGVLGRARVNGPASACGHGLRRRQQLGRGVRQANGLGCARVSRPGCVRARAGWRVGTGRQVWAGAEALRKLGWWLRFGSGPEMEKGLLG